MWNTRSTFPPPPAPARNKALNKRKALAGSSGGGLAFFIPALFLFRPAPPSKLSKASRPPLARFRPLPPRPRLCFIPSSPERCSLPLGRCRCSRLFFLALPSGLVFATRSHLDHLLCPTTPAPVVHLPLHPSTSRPTRPLPPQPPTPAPATHSRLGHSLPP